MKGAEKENIVRNIFFFEIFFSRALLSDRYPYLIICCSILDILSTMYIAAIIGERLQYTLGSRPRSTRLMYVLVINKHMLLQVLSYFTLSQ